MEKKLYRVDAAMIEGVSGTAKRGGGTYMKVLIWGKSVVKMHDFVITSVVKCYDATIHKGGEDTESRFSDEGGDFVRRFMVKPCVIEIDGQVLQSPETALL